MDYLYTKKEGQVVVTATKKESVLKMCHIQSGSHLGKLNFKIKIYTLQTCSLRKRMIFHSGQIKFPSVLLLDDSVIP